LVELFCSWFQSRDVLLAWRVYFAPRYQWLGRGMAAQLTRRRAAFRVLW
jgi:hypothetical protein